ncbi:MULTISPECIES: lipid A export permease/ATP-binding protein MsbA [Methylococcus]|uniref:Lipid A export permease/ATP-binding protein MsbA n=1 Tax=Methylococcus capsulatus TaxID=414 RepID=A0ABZ2F275_METCP|nr:MULTISPECIES: lipid A export permease/ATP-binding protein MsbA [Methylococcus]MDF9392210.1 lipid A export permease/ATP-binding protein MsbA [Methylococcus capsulatus]
MKHSATESKPLSSGLAIYRRLLRYGYPYWKSFFVAVLAMIAYAAITPFFAKLIQPLIDGSFIDNDPTVLRHVSLMLIGLSVLRGIAGFLSDYCSGSVGRRVIADLRRDIFDQLLNLPCGFYDNASGGQLLSKLLYNTEQVSASLQQGIITCIREGFTVVGLMALMVYQNLVLSLVFLVLGPVLGLSVRFVSKRFRRLSMRIQESMGKVSHVTQEVIDAQRIVKVFNGKAYEAAKFARENDRNQKRQMKLIATDALGGGVIHLISVAGVAGILYVVSLDSVRQTITPGSLMAFIAAMAMMLSPIRRLSQVVSVMQRGIAAGDSIFAMLDLPRERDQGRISLKHARGSIEYRHVSLVYDDRHGAAVDDVSLVIPAGKTVALVGQSGSGKTSLVRLLPRLYEATAGEILIDGYDIRELTLESLRRQIAYVGQEVTLFNDTVANNIAYGCLDSVGLDAVREAARAANALDFIEALPRGFDTLVGQQGIVLSGGQRQRIAIARALLKNAPILILDEATSALDAESERYVQQALEVLMRNRTTLVIAHRLSTIQNADQICVMRGGRIIECGTHAQLMAARGGYADLYAMQFGYSSVPEAVAVHAVSR